MLELLTCSAPVSQCSEPVRKLFFREVMAADQLMLSSTLIMMKQREVLEGAADAEPGRAFGLRPVMFLPW